MFCKKDILRNFAKFTGKRLCQSLFFNKVAGLRPATLLKKRLWHRRFPVNFAKFLRAPFFIEHLWGLLLLLWFYVWTSSSILRFYSLHKIRKYLRNFYNTLTLEFSCKFLHIFRTSLHKKTYGGVLKDENCFFSKTCRRNSNVKDWSEEPLQSSSYAIIWFTYIIFNLSFLFRVPRHP